MKYYKIYPKAYGIQLGNLGARYILNGQNLEGKKYFLKSIKVNPLNIKSYIYFFCLQLQTLQNAKICKKRDKG